jgi:hypothetical protein
MRVNDYPRFLFLNGLKGGFFETWHIISFGGIQISYLNFPKIRNWSMIFEEI